MTPIKRYTKDDSGIKRLTLTLDPFAFICNTFAMGDVIAASAVIKYLLDNFYVTPESHIVVAKKNFRLFFPYVADANFRDFDDKSQSLWGIPETFPLGLLNKQKEARFVKVTPKQIHLSQYAGLMFADTIIPLEKIPYVSTPKCDVSHFGVDFTNSVVLVVSYRDKSRSWPTDSILGVARWLQEQGITPVFVGKTDMDLHLKPSLIPKTALPDDISDYGVDLRNKTSLIEMVSIMALSKAVCGVDSGPIHVAGTTDVPIICGYPTVSAEFRIPQRTHGVTYPITPVIECANCESRWRSTYWNFENCFFGHEACCQEFSADKFISHLQNVLKSKQGPV